MSFSKSEALLFFILTLFIGSCQSDKVEYPNKNLTLESFGALRDSAYMLSYSQITGVAERFSRKYSDSTLVDRNNRKYYRENNPIVWSDRFGMAHQADTAMKYIRKGYEHGISPKALYLSNINDCYKRLKRLNFDKKHPINKVLGEFDYYMSKSFLRYTCGMQFGFIDPCDILNHFSEDDDTCQPKVLFDLDIAKNSNEYIDSIRALAKHNKIGSLLAEVQPTDSIYKQMQAMYIDITRHRPDTVKLDSADVVRLLLNMERLRWKPTLKRGNKYVEVNIPSYTVRGVDYERHYIEEMKVVVGKKNHNTPILSSMIKWVEINPQWTVPKKILRKETLVGYAKDKNYLAKHDLRVYEKVMKPNSDRYQLKPVDIASLKNPNEILKEKYSVRESRGKRSSIGRMIFRFENNFSVFLHGTPEDYMFRRENRGASHGCVRLERPIDLMLFLFNKEKRNDSLLIDKIRVATDLKPRTKQGYEKYLKNKKNNEITYFSRLFDPSIPLFIRYFTVYPDRKDSLCFYKDNYKYDMVLWSYLSDYSDVQKWLKAKSKPARVQYLTGDALRKKREEKAERERKEQERLAKEEARKAKAEETLKKKKTDNNNSSDKNSPKDSKNKKK